MMPAAHANSPPVWIASSGRRHHDAFVLGPAYAPGQGNVLEFTWLGFEGPLQHAAPVAQVGRGRRRRRGQHFDLNLFIFADRQLILDGDPDREIMAIANNSLERALVGLRCRHDQARRAFVAFDDGTFNLDLVIGAETKPYALLLAR